LAIPIVFEVNDEEYEWVSDDAIHVGYRRPELELVDADLDKDLPDHVKVRLFLSRQLALKKYQEVWG
jgi:hypothetical protein